MSKTLKDVFISIMEQYPSVRSSSSYPGDGKMKNLIEVTITKFIHSYISSKWNNIDWKVEGSAGKGQWAAIPWIALINTNITTTVSNGVYIVFLFSAKGNKVFLTLNQGTGGINRAQSGQSQNEIREKYLSKVPQKNQTFIKGALRNNSLEGDGNQRAKAYEEACILWKEYKLSDLKNMKDDSSLTNDIKELVQYYKLSDKLFDKNNNIYHTENGIPEQIENFSLQKLHEIIESTGLKFDKNTIARFISALITKPFVILTGLSGSGKTKLAQAFSQWICENEIQTRLIPV